MAIGRLEPGRDPRLGDRRQKALRQRLAAQLAQQQAVARRTGVGRVARSTGRPSARVGIGGARPAGTLGGLKTPMLNFMRGNGGRGQAAEHRPAWAGPAPAAAALPLPISHQPMSGDGAAMGPTGLPPSADPQLEALYPGMGLNPALAQQYPGLLSPDAVVASMLGSSPGASLADIVPGYMSPTPAPAYVTDPLLRLAKLEGDLSLLGGGGRHLT